MTLTVDTEAASQRFLTVSNLLSISRSPFDSLRTRHACPLGRPLRFWALGILSVAMLTDFLDGMIARARGEDTEWGKILDPLADKVCVAVDGACPAQLGDLPLWFVASHSWRATS